VDSYVNLRVSPEMKSSQLDVHVLKSGQVTLELEISVYKD